MNSILLFDESKPSPTVSQIVIYTLIILITSNVIFNIIVAGQNTETEQGSYNKWSNDHISKWTLLFNEIFTASILSPISEELLFRFLIMKIICTSKLKLDPMCSNVIQSVIFSTAHFSNTIYAEQSLRFTYLQMINSFIMGMISGFVYVHSNSIIPSLLAHMIHNSVAGLKEFNGYCRYLESTKIVSRGKTL